MDDVMTMKEELVRLLSEKKYSQVISLIADAQAADVAEIVEELPQESKVLLYRLLPKELAAEVFVEMDSDSQEVLIESFTDREITEIVEELYYDDTVDIIEEMPANVVQRILKNAMPESRKNINELLKYPEDSAGSIMTTEYVRLRPKMTVKEALDLIREVAIEKETIYTCYVTERRKLVGIVTAKDLLISPLDAVIGNIMETNVVSVSAYDDQEHIALMFDRYDYLALPVVDKEGLLTGIITVDDAIDVMHEETEEDFAKMAAITPNDTPYLKTSVAKIWLARIPWLLLLMISATFTGIIISSFEAALAAQVALTAFIPMLMDSGGNSGSQASVTVIRGISLGEVEFRDIFAVMWKELRVSILCGVSLAAATYLKIMLVDNLIMGGSISPTVALVVSLTLCLTVICAKLIGCTLPMFADKLGFDPAVMASPFITTIVDAVSLLVYFAIATSLLHI